MTVHIGVLPSSIARNPYRYNYQVVIIEKNRNKALGQERWLPRKLKQEILQRDQNICQVCGEPANQVDHIIPWRISNDNSRSNLRAICGRCNTLRRLKRRDARPNFAEWEQWLKEEIKNGKQ